MGFHGFSFGSLLIILIIAVLLFGTKRIRNIGEDLGAALKSFRKGLQGDASQEPDSAPAKTESQPAIKKEDHV
jgi:sec-independent protein translocase protein TatA